MSSQSAYPLNKYTVCAQIYGCTVYNVQQIFSIVSLNCRGWFALNIVFTVYYAVFVFLRQPSFRLSIELHAEVNQVLDQCSWSLSAYLTALFQTRKTSVLTSLLCQVPSFKSKTTVKPLFTSNSIW